MIDALPKYVNHASRYGHNLGHDFSFTSSTGHLLTLFGCRMQPKDTIQGRVDMFTRTQPLVQPANVEIEEFIDYFFVPLEMLYSGMGDYLYQVNEPYSSVTQRNLSVNRPNLPILDWEAEVQDSLSNIFGVYTNGDVINPGIQVDPEEVGFADTYGLDNGFLSVYRNLFHNYYNPNALFKWVRDFEQSHGTSLDYAIPADYFQPNVFPIYLMAYNCIYQHFYRLDDREEFNSETYNIDSVVFGGGTLSENFGRDFFDLKYRPRFFDYFTSAKVAPLINSNNVLSSGPATDLTSINNYMSINGIRLTNELDGNPQNLESATGVRPSVNVWTTSNLRSMFAVEKLLSITNRAKKTYDAQVLAHLGVDMPTDYFHQIQFIGSQRSTIKVGEVVATASGVDGSGTSVPLGDVAGKGYSVMGSDGVKFTAPCDGVFMAIYSAVPRVRYYAPLEKHAMITSRLSFFQPEFAKLGMQPIFGYEAFAAPEASTEYSANTDVLGWQMRYEELKSRFNKVSPAFVDTIVYSSTTFVQDYVQTFNDWHTWTVIERPYQAGNNVSAIELKNLLANPYMLNGLMAESYLKPEDWIHAYLGTGFYLFESSRVLERHSFAWNVASLFKKDPLLHFAKCNFKVVNKIPDNTLVELHEM